MVGPSPTSFYSGTEPKGISREDKGSETAPSAKSKQTLVTGAVLFLLVRGPDPAREGAGCRCDHPRSLDRGATLLMIRRQRESKTVLRMWAQLRSRGSVRVSEKAFLTRMSWNHLSRPDRAVVAASRESEGSKRSLRARPPGEPAREPGQGLSVAGEKPPGPGGKRGPRWGFFRELKKCAMNS